MTQGEVVISEGSEVGSFSKGGSGSDFPSLPEGGGIAATSKIGSATPERKATNRHPADELADIRSEIQKLEKRETELREYLIGNQHDLDGDEFSVFLTKMSRTTVDRKAIEKAMGKSWLEKFLKNSEMIRVVVRERVANEEGA